MSERDATQNEDAPGDALTDASEPTTSTSEASSSTSEASSSDAQPTATSDTDPTMTDAAPPMEAYRYENGTITYPGHPIGPGDSEPVDTVDLGEYTGEVVTWTTSTATPPGVREPNHVAIVEFDVDGESVRAIGQLTTGDVEVGDEVEPVYVEELRDPEAGIKEPESQDWDGYRFDPL